jgi:hypothetical protein
VSRHQRSGQAGSSLNLGPMFDPWMIKLPTYGCTSMALSLWRDVILMNHLKISEFGDTSKAGITAESFCWSWYHHTQNSFFSHSLYYHILGRIHVMIGFSTHVIGAYLPPGSDTREFGVFYSLTSCEDLVFGEGKKR